jgi:hypothetical protein
MDPRVKTSRSDLEREVEVSMLVARGESDAATAIAETQRLLERLADVRRRIAGHGDVLVREVAALDAKLHAILGPAPAGFSQRPGTQATVTDSSSLRYVKGRLGAAYAVIQSTDAAPSPDAMTDVDQTLALLHEQQARLAGLETHDLAHVNDMLRNANLPPVEPAGRAR